MSLNDKFNLSVKRSKINGLGLFSEQKISKDEYCEYILPIIEEDEWDNLIEDKERFFFFESIYDLRECKLKYLNHSENPNIDYDEVGDKVRIIALEDIRHGEELTIDYGWDGEEKRFKFKTI